MDLLPLEDLFEEDLLFEADFLEALEDFALEFEPRDLLLVDALLLEDDPLETPLERPLLLELLDDADLLVLGVVALELLLFVLGALLRFAFDVLAPVSP